MSPNAKAQSMIRGAAQLKAREELCPTAGGGRLSPLAQLGNSSRVVTVSLGQLVAGLQERQAPGQEREADDQVTKTLSILQESRAPSCRGEIDGQAARNPSEADDQVAKTLSILREERSREGQPCAWYMPPGNLLGLWLDSYGNSVHVRSNGEPLTQLTAVLSRSPRPDIYLSLWQTADGSGWYCGQAKLDASATSAEKVTWAFPDGRISVWTWQAYTMESLAVQGLALPQGSGVPGESVPMMLGDSTPVWVMRC